MQLADPWPVYSPFAKAHFAKGHSAALMAVLEARNLPVSNRARQRIHECFDDEQLQKWIRRAATAHSTDVIFD